MAIAQPTPITVDDVISPGYSSSSVTFEHARHLEGSRRSTTGELPEREFQEIEGCANEEVDAEVRYEKGS